MLKPGDILEALPDHEFCYTKGILWVFVGDDPIEDEFGYLGYSLKNLSDGQVHRGFYMEETLLNPSYFKIHSVDLENK